MIEFVNRLQRKYSSHILLYHATYSMVPNDLKKELHNVKPEEMYKQIEWLKKYFDIVKVDQIFSGQDVSGKIAITFDDAYMSVFDEAVPVLDSLAVPCTIYINGVSLEGKPFWRDKVRFLINNDLVSDFCSFHADYCVANKIDTENFYRITKTIGINSFEFDGLLDDYFANKSISTDSMVNCIHDKTLITNHPLVSYGNHTYNHYMLSSLTVEQQELEIKKNHEFLENSGINLSSVFSIPFGGDGDFTNETIDFLEKYKYSGFLYSRGRINIKRLRPFNTDSMSLLYGERYMVNPDFQSFQKQIAKLGLRSIIANISH